MGGRPGLPYLFLPAEVLHWRGLGWLSSPWVETKGQRLLISLPVAGLSVGGLTPMAPWRTEVTLGSGRTGTNASDADGQAARWSLGRWLCLGSSTLERPGGRRCRGQLASMLLPRPARGCPPAHAHLQGICSADIAGRGLPAPMHPGSLFTQAAGVCISSRDHIFRDHSSDLVVTKERGEWRQRKEGLALKEDPRHLAHARDRVLEAPRPGNFPRSPGRVHGAGARWGQGG